MAQPNERGVGLMRADAGGSADRPQRRQGRQPARHLGRLGHPGAARGPVRDRRRLGRPLGGGGCRPARRQRGADREAPHGRRLPELRLRAVQGAAGRRRAGPSRCAPPTPFGIVPTNPSIGYRGRARPRAWRHRRHRAQRFGRAVHRPRRQGDQGHRPVHQPRHRGGRRHAREGAPLRDRHRLVAGHSAHPGPRERRPISPTRRSSTTATSSIIWSSSAAARSGWSWPRRTCGSAAASPSSRR